MSTVLPVKAFNFTKNLSLLNQNASLGFAVSTARPDVLLPLASDTQPFGPGDIELAEVSLNASTAKPIEFSRGTDKVSFTASGSAFAGFGVYRTGATLLKRLGDRAEDFSLEALEFGVDNQTSLLGVLRWGYAIEAKGNGAIALGAIGSATVKASGNSEGLFAVIRRLPSTTPARAVVQSVGDSWVIPRQIVSIDQIEPGTWIVAEVIGGMSVSLGAQIGYDFNWVREAKLGGLTGDIGLRLQMGVNAAIGFSAAGRCAVVVSRESAAQALRLRFFRLKTRELDLSFNASLAVQAKDKLLPDKIDDFIAAVFDTHGQQILRDLQVLEKWTDPNVKLSELLAKAGVEGAEALIARLAGVTTEQLQQSFDAVHAKAVSFIKQWHDLPHRVASTLFKLVEDKIDLSDVRAVAKRLSTITPADLERLLNEQLNRIDFFHTPVGKFLESIADESVLSLGTRLDEVKAVATKVVAILDGSTLEETLKSFQAFVEAELHLTKVFKTVTETDFATLDALLKKKLANFLDQQVVALADLDKIRKAINLLLQKREEYYEKALEALHRKYTFALNATWQSTTTDTALLDATFDFSHDPAAVSDFFQQAVQGKLDGLLQTQPAQVAIAAGKLSHGIKRQTHVDVSLPFMDSKHSHLNESLASLEAVPHGGGLLFKLKASDTVTSSNQRKSILSLAMSLSKSRGTGVRVHQDSLEMNYSLLFAKRNMQTKHVRAQVGPALRTHFKEKVTSTERFIELLDNETEAAIPNGPNLLGNGMISLDIALSPSAAMAAGRAWLSLPPDRTADVYANLSTAIQASLKRNVFDSAFGSPEDYSQTSVARTRLFIAYCALVPRALKNLNWFWDWPSPADRRVTLNHPQTLVRMRELLTRSQEVLLNDPEAKHFRPEEAEDILAGVDSADPFLNTLLASENEIIQDAIAGGVGIAVGQNASPTDAVKALAKFGSKLTEAFHSDISTLLGAGLQSLGTRVFLDASRAITATKISETSAMLNVEFLKPNVKFDDAALLAAGHVPPDQLAFADRVVEISS
jgi:hypothetical protein